MDVAAASARHATLVELVRRREVVRVVDALAEAGVAPLLFKGTALAYTIYPSPLDRPRLDTDLLVSVAHAVRAGDVLAAFGYRLVPRTSGEHVTHQTTYEREPADGIACVFDVHWKVFDPAVFADVFSYDELAASAVDVPALGAHARAVSEVHALLIACAHRVAHHFDQDVPIFTRDIDLLARRMDAAGWASVVDVAARTGIRAVVGRGLDLAQARFATAVPGTVMAALSSGQHEEATAAFLRPKLRKVDVLRSDLGVLRGWQRVRLIREHLLPPPQFVLSSYPRASPALLPALYVHRILAGARRWFQPLR